MALEDEVASHYSRDDLLEQILAALAQAGIAGDALSYEHLKPVDEFHIGGLTATRALAEQIDLAPAMRVLDIGCGIGGTSRFLANEYGVEIVGVDLTPSYVKTAGQLSNLVGLGARTSYIAGSATELPFDADEFDAAVMLHVGMNIPDKAKLMTEAARVLKPGATFAVYDIMKIGSGTPDYPVPWAEVAENSFLATLEDYRTAAQAAGFSEVSSRDRSGIALDFFAEQRRRAEADGLPPVGLHILMGKTFPMKIANMVQAIADHAIAPTELILRRGES